MIELLAPAGSKEKLITALNYGADACYFAGKKYGLRAFSDNFEEEELEEYIKYTHSLGKKAYITVNIIAHNRDFEGLSDYLKYLEKIGADAVIVADIGIAKLVKEVAPKLALHISTQANITNYYSAKFFEEMGADRIIMARELSLEELKKIRESVSCEMESFVHGAMCISYSGRCLLSNYFTGRDSNGGACVQACRWQYAINEVDRKGNYYPIEEDERGTYILNSKDLNMITHLAELKEAGITSFKIEGRMKSKYYVAAVVNAYRRAIDALNRGEELPKELIEELEKVSHRQYTTGFYCGANDKECLSSSLPVQTAEYMADVLTDSDEDGFVIIEQRNRFKVGDELEILSPTDSFNKKFVVTQMFNEKGEPVLDAKNVQEKLKIYCPVKLQKYDILRK